MLVTTVLLVGGFEELLDIDMGSVHQPMAGPQSVCALAIVLLQDGIP